jgi:type IV fimbrial biogenesis protein FimT
MLVKRRHHGVTLIELMIGIAILAILLLAGLPSFNVWIQNTQVRSAAESIQNGLQTARNEAVRRNAKVRLNLTNTSGLVAWTVGCVTVTVDCPATIQRRPAAEAGGGARVGVSTAVQTAADYGTALAAGAGLSSGAGVTFNNLGGIANIGSDITRIDIRHATAGARRLVVNVGTGGLIRMCDPALSLTSNPQGCV